MDIASVSVGVAGRRAAAEPALVRQTGEAAPGRAALTAPVEPAAQAGRTASSRPSDALGPEAQEALVRSQTEETGPDGLTDAERVLVQDLSARDQEVRRHEEAHARVGGEYAGMPSYTYQTGPDGRRYAIGGEVSIDTAPVEGDPEATIVKMDVVKRAALAPVEPSFADRRIAALADAQRLEAQAELNSQRLGAPEETASEGASIVVLADIVRRGPEREPGQVFARAA